MNRLILIVLAAVCAVWVGAQSRTDSVACVVPGDSVVEVVAEKPYTPKFHRFLISFGTTIPFNKSVLWMFAESAHIRVVKNVYVGVSYESHFDRTWQMKEYTDTLCGYSVEFSVLAFSNPIFRKKKFTAGVWGEIGYGHYSASRVLTFETEHEDYGDEYWGKMDESYLKCVGGLYFKYRGIYATVGYNFNNLELKPFGQKVHSGLLRGPALHGLSIMLRFGI